LADRGGIKGVLRYALFDLLGAIHLWILAGVLVAALIGSSIPTDYLINMSWTQGLGGMLLVLVISIPLYVCTTGSVPIAASLIAAGMPPGTALVFLMAGPATNVATLGAVYRALGGRVLGIYLGTVVVMSVLLGLTFDSLLQDSGAAPVMHEHGADWLTLGSALLLSGLLAYLLLARLGALFRIGAAAAPDGGGVLLKVEGMSCQHCVASVKRALEGFDEVTLATPDLSSGLVQICGDHLDIAALVDAVKKAGFQASPSQDN
jgi:copper chaperone CopZ